MLTKSRRSTDNELDLRAYPHHKLDDEIRRLEAKLVEMKRKRRGTYKVAGWRWCLGCGGHDFPREMLGACSTACAIGPCPTGKA